MMMMVLFWTIWSMIWRSGEFKILVCGIGMADSFFILLSALSVAEADTLHIMFGVFTLSAVAFT
jgi:hypothetical protein